jgi:hypothetical protein
MLSEGLESDIKSETNWSLVLKLSVCPAFAGIGCARMSCVQFSRAIEALCIAWFLVGQDVEDWRFVEDVENSQEKSREVGAIKAERRTV